MVLDTLKKRLHDAANTKGGKWIKELPNALWRLRTQPTKPTGQLPYFLVYGPEAILPADVMWESLAVEQYDEGISQHSRRVDINGLEEALKDQLGELERGSEWEPIQILLEGMETPTRRTRLPKHISYSTTQVGQDHVATGVLLVLGTTTQLHRLKNAAELAIRAPLTCIRQTREQHRSDRSLLELTTKFWELPQKAPTPVRPV
jgi:hypothetical protein